MNKLPRLFRLRQNFPKSPPFDARAAVGGEFARVPLPIKAGARIAIAVGSRGISNLAAIVGAVVEQVVKAGAHPFIVPAMGSHGGASADGQREVLARYGITEAATAAPVRSSMEVRQIGTAEGAPVFCSVEALEADGVLLVNRVKPHTDFIGNIGSGLLKMCVIGLGKRTGAASMHATASRLGHERVIRAMAKVILRQAPVIGGLAILEDQWHQTAKVVVLPAAEFEPGEERLFVESRALMPRLPFEEIDLLIVDRLGKNISGAGMDPNITGRWVQGYSTSLMRDGRPSPFIRRIFVRDLTPETHGNAIGIGLADVTTSRLVRAMDHAVTYVNALTSLTPETAKIPIHFETDREAIDLALTSLALSESRQARIVRIQDTLSLARMAASEALLEEARGWAAVEVTGAVEEMKFDGEGNLE